MTHIKTAVIGFPISHSKSPIIHNYWIDKYGLDGAYEAIEIKPDTLEVSIKSLIDHGFTGFNVTVPHKEKMLQLCDHVDDNARKIGAVNTVRIKDDVLYGYNTDVFGFIENLKQNAPDFKPSGLKVGLLGAGGATRAAIAGFLNENISKIFISNRTKERAETLKSFAPDKIEIVDWDKKEHMLENIDLLVNTTSLGMLGHENLNVSLDGLKQQTIVYDIVYNPLHTKLMANANKKGNKTVTGIGMLLHQARPAFEKWYGVLPDIDENLENLVLK